MAYEAAFAAVYFCFAIIFAIANVMTQDVQTRSDMYKAVSSAYITMPYQNNPDKFFEDIATPDDLYKWFRFVFVPATFMEQPMNSDSNGYCLDSAPCYIDQGDCDTSLQCANSLTCRDMTAVDEGYLINNHYWDRIDVIEWCEYLGTPLDTTIFEQNCNPTVDAAASSGPGPCCWDPHAESFITRIDVIDETVHSMVSDVEGRFNCPSSMSPLIDCCATSTPDPITVNETQTRATEAFADKFSVTVGNFNRLLFTRLTMKRYILSANDNPTFGYLVGNKLKGDGKPISAQTNNGVLEDKTPITGYDGNITEYVIDGSFGENGGYSKSFPTLQRADVWASFLERLNLDLWFDQRMGSAVLETFFYNGNTDTFMYICFFFEFDFAGKCTKKMQPLFINLNSQQYSGKYAVPRIIEKILIALVIFFFLVELNKMRTTVNYFGKPTKLVDLASLALCSTVLLLNFLIAYNETYVNFDFDTILKDPSMTARAELMQNFWALLSLASFQTHLVAVNMLMIFVRAVMLVTQLEGQLGLITNTLAAAGARLSFFFFQYMLLLMGFVAFAYFTFGQSPEESGMTDFPMTFYVVFAMLVGLSNKDDLEAADSSMTPIFIIIFYVVTIFVMQNMFVSILLSGYDQVLLDLENKEKKNGKDKNFLIAIAADYKQIFGLGFNFLKDSVVWIWTRSLKYIWDGLTSCFWSIIEACDCGCPNPFKVCLNCLRACRKPKKEKEVSPEMYEKEFKELEKQIKKGDKWLNGIKGDPGSELAMKEKIRYAEMAKKKVEDHNKELAASGAKDDNDTLAGMWREMRQTRMALKDEITEQKKKESVTELLIMGVFLSTFIGTMILLVSMGDAYILQESSLNPVLDKVWLTPGTLKITGFQGIQNFEDVGEWAFAAVLGLYQYMECRTYPVQGQPTPPAQCDNGENNMQLVNTVNKWNIGFMNSTFVRVTIQPACFITNPEERWRKGFEYMRSSAEAGSCATDACFENAMKAESTCLDAVGEDISVANTFVKDSLGTNFEIKYNYSQQGKLGPFELTGGFTVSLGTSAAECKQMLNNLREDRWFSKNSVSIVFDWVTYNGNFDYFAYNNVQFNLLPTGRISSAYQTKGVPLNADRGGNWYRIYRIIVLVLFTLYGLMVFYFLSKVLRDLNRERNRSKGAGQGGFHFFLAYYKNGWNCADTLSQILSIYSLLTFLDYMLTPFRYQYKFSVNALDKYTVPNADVQKFGMRKDTDPARGLEDDWFIFLAFETICKKYGALLDIAALNSFFISIRVVKHVNQSALVKVYSGTLSSGITRQAYFLFVILLLLAGWALFFMIIFGNVDNNLSSLWISIRSLFMWILGTFDLKNMLEENKGLTIIFFVLYQILMNFVAINMFLATMLNTYSTTVGTNEVDREREKLKREHETLYTMVEYKDKAEFKKDITAIDVDPDTREVYVKSRSKDGSAYRNNIREGGLVGGGHQITKVNGKSDGWNQYDTIQEIYDLGIAEDDRDHMVRIIFKESEAEKKGCSEFFGTIFGRDDKETKSLQDIKPTVKGFWRKFGAVTQINAEIEKQMQLMDTDLAADDKEDDDDDDDLDGGGSDKGDSKNNAIARAVKARVKKRLENLLFSRAVKVAGQQEDGSDPFDVADQQSDFQKEPGEDVKTEDEMPIDDIRETIETEGIQGWEVWLDCLISQIELEPEMEDECVVTEVLRTTEMQEVHKSRARRNAGQNILEAFYCHASDVLSTLEFKAKKKYYEKLRIESRKRFLMFEEQNKVLHDYACELEKEFSKIMENIHKYRDKKDKMRAKLAMLLDKDMYRHLETNGAPDDRSHMARFSSASWAEGANQSTTNV